MAEENNPIVLIVEDEIPLSNAIKTKLEAAGMNPIAVQSASQAEELLEANKEVRAIWLDHYLLGGVDGLQFLARIKQEGSAWRDVPVFVVSNTATQDKVEAYMQLGAEKFFTKAHSSLENIIDELKSVLGSTTTA